MRHRKIGLCILSLLAVMPALFLLMAQRSLRQFEGMKPGDRLPRARLHLIGEGWVETDSWSGKPMLLVVVQPGCKACRSEIETLASIAPSFPGVRIALLSTQGEWKDWRTPFPVYADPGGGFLSKVRRLVTPALYWIDASGKVRYARTGARSAKEEHENVRRLLEGIRP